MTPPKARDRAADKSGKSENLQIDPKRLGDHCTFVLPGWRRAVFPFACASISAAGATLIVGDPPQPAVGWSLFALGLVTGVVFLIAVVFLKRLQVRLDRDGLTVARLLTTQRFTWDEVSEFSVAARSPGRSANLAYVVFDTEHPPGIMQGLNRFLAGRGQILPIGLVLEDGSGNAEVVAALLNAWRERALRIRRKA